MRFSRVGLHNLQNLTTAHIYKPVNIEHGQGAEFKTITIETYRSQYMTQTALLLSVKVCVISYEHLLHIKLLTFYG